MAIVWPFVEGMILLAPWKNSDYAESGIGILPVMAAAGTRPILVLAARKVNGRSDGS
jgi:hypothetical protein